VVAGCNVAVCGCDTTIGARGVVRGAYQNMERRATHWRKLLWSAHGSSVGTHQSAWLWNRGMMLKGKAM